MPHYCGGRFIYGFWTSSDLYKPVHASNDKNPWDGEFSDKNIFNGCSTNIQLSSDKITKFDQYMPDDLTLAQLLLKKLLFFCGDAGVVYAVTSPSQKQGVKLLDMSGFKQIGKYKKDYSESICTTWVGDYNKDVKPILMKVPDAITVSSKFSK